MNIVQTKSTSKKGKQYGATLLRESYREGGKVKNRTIANLSHCKPQEIEAIRLALKYRDDLTVLGSFKESVELKEGPSLGAVWTAYAMARELGIERALGTDRAGKLALWQVIARVVGQGSRLSATRLAQTTAGCDVLGIREGFDENSLYDNLGWLAANQEKIEQRLMTIRGKGATPQLFLYDVTSSYLEGESNELGAWGYNRDKKKGKKQLVVGLLCDEMGYAITVEVFAGNTNDVSTFKSQVEKAAARYGCQQVTFVGDRGMIKSGQIEDLKAAGYHYITAITKAQIRTLIREGTFQLSLFEEKLCEVLDEGVRYVLRRNPHRADEIAANRQGKQSNIEAAVATMNKQLEAKPKASVEIRVKRVKEKIAKLKVEKWLSVKAYGRRLELVKDEEALRRESELDGCYSLKSDLPGELASLEIIHERYKDLAKVEQAFRTSKSGPLEIRPWFVRTEESTRGHALVVMLGYLIVLKLQKAWANSDVTVREGLNQLASLSVIEMTIKDGGSFHRIPTPRERSAELLKAAGIQMPTVLPNLGANVVTRKILKRKT